MSRTLSTWTAGLAVVLLAGASAQAQVQPVTPPVQPAEAAAPLAAEAQAPEVTLELIMSDPDWLGNPPENAYFADDGRSIFYSQKRPGEEVRDLVQIDLQGEVLRTVALSDLGAVDAPGGELSRDRKRKAYVREGDLFVKDLQSGELKQLTRTAEQERSPRFLADGKSVAFRRGDLLFVRDLASGLERQVAELKLEQDPAKKEEPFNYLREQQPRLIEFVREKKEKEEARREREMALRRADPTRLPPPFYLGEKLEIRQLSLSPSGEWLLVALGKKEEDEGKKELMPNYVTASGYVETKEVRSKVGTGEGAGESLLLLDLAGGEIHTLALDVLPGIADDPLKEIREKTEAARKAKKEADAKRGLQVEDLPLEVPSPPVTEGDEATTGLAATVEPGPEEAAAAEPPAGDKPAPPKPRPVTFRDAEWSEDGRRLAISAFSVDNKDRWIATVDFEKQALVPVHHLRDQAWLGWDFDELGFLPDGERLWYLSEESGFSQLYLVDLGVDPPAADPQAEPAAEAPASEASAGQPAAAGEPAPAAPAPAFPRRQLTSGEQLVSEVRASHDGAYLYYRANPDHPGVYEVFRVAVESGEVEPLVRLGGLNSYQLSLDEKLLLVEHSAAAQPVELYLQKNEPGEEATRLTETVSPKFAAIDWTLPRFVPVPSTHTSRPIHSRVYLPTEDESPDGGATAAAASRPAVVFIHGAGYLQNAHQGWSTYFREFMFHTFLTRRGYVVLDMDYRASAGYGRDWRTAIYRQMGTPELEDLEDGVAHLVAEHGVDPARVGVYGGSYGGFLTMMALFKKPDLFAAGAALRPVTDWAHYNHGYTSSILNTPTLDPEAYERSSPIELADGLAKPLLICAPMQDDNVFFQDTVRLAQRLIELEKENWEVAIFPVEPHGFREPSSWLNEYRRIYKLFEENLGSR